MQTVLVMQQYHTEIFVQMNASDCRYNTRLLKNWNENIFKLKTLINIVFLNFASLFEKEADLMVLMMNSSV